MVLNGEVVMESKLYDHKIEQNKRKVRRICNENITKKVDEIENNDLATLEKYKAIIKTIAYCRRLRDLRIERIDELAKLRKESKGFHNETGGTDIDQAVEKD